VLTSPGQPSLPRQLQPFHLHNSLLWFLFAYSSILQTWPCIEEAKLTGFLVLNSYCHSDCARRKELRREVCALLQNSRNSPSKTVLDICPGEVLLDPPVVLYPVFSQLHLYHNIVTWPLTSPGNPPLPSLTVLPARLCSSSCSQMFSLPEKLQLFLPWHSGVALQASPVLLALQ
jgi:hypothetical protein